MISILKDSVLATYNYDEFGNVLSKATMESVSKDAAASFVEGTINGNLSEQAVLVYEKNK